MIRNPEDYIHLCQQSERFPAQLLTLRALAFFQHHGQHFTVACFFFSPCPLFFFFLLASHKRLESHSLPWQHSTAEHSQDVHKMVTPPVKWRKVGDNLARGSFSIVMRSTFFFFFDIINYWFKREGGKMGQ